MSPTPLNCVLNLCFICVLKPQEHLKKIISEKKLRKIYIQEKSFFSLSYPPPPLLLFLGFQMIVPVVLCTVSWRSLLGLYGVSRLFRT